MDSWGGTFTDVFHVIYSLKSKETNRRYKISLEILVTLHSYDSYDVSSENLVLDQPLIH